MAGFRVHLTTSTLLGIATGGAAWYSGRFDWGAACLGGGLMAVGGVLPDLDSASGKPVRELFGIAAMAAALILFPVVSTKLSPDQTTAALAGVYLFIRFGVSNLFRKLTVHRGMWHSIPAMLIAGLLVYHASDHPRQIHRLFLEIGRAHV